MMTNFEIFIAAIKKIKSSPDLYFSEILEMGIYFSDDSIRKTFFENKKSSPHSIYGQDKLATGYAELAVKYMSFVISDSQYKDFNNAIIPFTYKDIIGGWFNSNGVFFGKFLIVDYINKKNNMSKILKNKDQFLLELKDKCCTIPFINGLMIEATLGSSLPAIAFLNYVDYLDPSQVSSDEFLKVWMNNTEFKKTINYRDYDWLETTSGLLEENSSIFDSIKIEVMAALKKKTTKTQAKWYWFGQTRSTKTYGKDVVNWLDSKSGPKKYNLRSKTNPNNQTESLTVPHRGH